MKIRWIAALGAVLALSATLPASAITIYFDPASQFVSVGSTTTVDVSIAGLTNGAAPSLGVFDLDIGFDPVLLDFQGAAFGDQLDLFGLGNSQGITPGVGTVNLYEFSFDAAADLDSFQAPSFVLATLSFNVLSTGNSPLSLLVNALGDSLGDPLAFDAPIAGNITSVSAVPEPTSLALIGIGILGIIGFTTRRGKLS